MAEFTEFPIPSTPIGDNAAEVRSAIGAASSAQGELADTAVQPVDITSRQTYRPTETYGAADLKQTLADLSTAGTLNVLAFGDSLSDELSARFVSDYLNDWHSNERMLGITWPSDVVVQSGTLGRARHVNGGSGPDSGFTIKSDYTIEPDGTYVQLDSTDTSLRFMANAGTARNGDRFYLPYKLSSGGASFTIQYSRDIDAWASETHASWTTPTEAMILSGETLTSGELLVSADGTGAEVIEVDVSSDGGMAVLLVQVVYQSGGTVRFAPPMMSGESNTDYVASNYWDIGESSNDFSSADSESVSTMIAMIDAFSPDVITVMSDDSGGDAYDNFLPMLNDAIASASVTKKPFVMLLGAGPKELESRQIGAISAAESLRRHATLYDWYFFDSLRLAGDWDTYSRLGYDTSDGIHLEVGFWGDAAAMIAEDLPWTVVPAVARTDMPFISDLSVAGLVSDWQSRVSVNSGTLSSLSSQAATALLSELSRAGLLDKCDYLLPFLGADNAAMVVPLVDGLAVGNGVINNPSEVSLTESGGWLNLSPTYDTALSLTSYLDTGIDSSVTDYLSDTWCIYFTGYSVVSGSPLGIRSTGVFGWETNMDLHPMGIVNSQRWPNSIYPTNSDGVHIWGHYNRAGRWSVNGVEQTSIAVDNDLVVSSKTLKLGVMDWFNGEGRETAANIGFFAHFAPLSISERYALYEIVAAWTSAMGR